MRRTSANVTLRDPKGPASEKQLAFLTSLLADRQDFADANGLVPDTVKSLTKEQASFWINEAKAAPLPNLSGGAVPATEPGFYSKDGEVYKLVISKSSGKPYVKVERQGGWEYVPGLAQRLTAADKMDLPAPIKETGFYYHDGKVYRVQESRSNGNLFAKELVPPAPGEAKGHFEYAPGKVLRLAASEKLTLAAAKALGLQMGVCIRCAALLSDPVSIAQGMGPVCIKKGV